MPYSGCSALHGVDPNLKKYINLNIYTPLQHALTHIILYFKIIDKANSKFNLKI